VSAHLDGEACIAEAFAWLGIPPFQETEIYAFALAFPLTVGVSVVSYYLVERPAMRLKDLVPDRLLVSSSP
jgi:peptidoglycan/LPS O-acetylase OafA/YrhL